MTRNIFDFVYRIAPWLIGPREMARRANPPDLAETRLRKWWHP